MNRKNILGLFALTFVLGTAFVTKIELEKKSLLNDRVELKVPSDFTIMSEEMMEIKYPSQNRPELVYTNETGGINVALSLSASAASQESLPDLLGQIKKTFESIYPSADWKDHGMTEVNNKKIGYIELVTPAMDTEIYNLIFFTDLEGKLLICTFNCVKKSMPEWRPTAKEIMNSLKVN